jgi:hypothetical protein
MRLLTMPVFLAFLSMGFADAVGPFVGPAKNEFQLSNLAASLIPFVGFSMFGLLSTLGLPDAVAGAPLYHLDAALNFKCAGA